MNNLFKFDDQSKSVFKGTLAALATYGCIKLAAIAGSAWYAKRKLQKAVKAPAEK